MTKLWLRLSPMLFGCLLMTACLAHPTSESKKNPSSLLVKGRSLTSTGLAAGKTAIFIEQTPAPEAISADDGSFEFTLDAARLEQLRLQYGLQKTMLRLYLVNESDHTESAVITSLSSQDRGEVSFAPIQLQPETLVTGRVLIGKSQELVMNARVKLGRKEVYTDADGTFSGFIPQFYTTPVLIEKKGFVQTLGVWLPSFLNRDFLLVDELMPYGNIEVIPSLRSLDKKMISLNYSATGNSQWIRLAASPNQLLKSIEPTAPWKDLTQELSFDPSSTIIYYQFADAEKTRLSPVFSYALPLTE